MPKFTYLTRRQGGVYYLAIRLPRAVGRGSKLCRFSLFTRDYREARLRALAHLKWLIPMKDTKSPEQLIHQLCLQLDQFIANRYASDVNDVRNRTAFLKRLLAYILMWKDAKLDPIEDRAIWEAFGRLREGAAILNLFLVPDMVRFGVHSYDEEPLARWSPPQIEQLGLGVPELPKDEVAVPGDFDHFSAMSMIRGFGEDDEIVRDYFSRYRPEVLPLLSQVAEPAPITWAHWQDVWDAERKLRQPPPYRSAILDAILREHSLKEPSAGDAVTNIPAVIAAQPVQSPAIVSHSQSETDEEVVETLSQAKRAFLSFQKERKGDGRTEEDAGLVIDFLIDFIGDIKLNALTSSRLLAFEKALAATPNRVGIPKEHRGSLMMRYRYAEKHGWTGLQPMSKTRIRNVWHGSLHQFFAWLRKKSFYSGPEFQFNLVPNNAIEAKDRDGWTNEELLRFFNLPLFTGCESKEHFWIPGNKFVQNELYWAYLIIVFAGMRNSEIGSLQTANIVKDAEGHWNFDLRVKKVGTDRSQQKRKTKYSERVFPVHQLLIDLGLLERKADLEAAGVTRLFPEWKDYTHKKSGRQMPGHHFSKSWQYVRTKFGFQREGLCVYSGRHTRASWYDAQSIATRIQNRILGHAPETVGQGYCNIYLTPEEKAVVRNAKLPIEEMIAEILLTAKLRADYKQLEVVKTWLNVRPKIRRKPPSGDRPQPTPAG